LRKRLIKNEISNLDELILMATVGKTITNSKTGQSYHFLQTAKSTNGSLLEMESVYDAYSKQPPMHYHPYQEEYFKILKGEITVKLGSVPKYLKQGDELYIPPNTNHAIWNTTDQPAVINWKVIPALESEYLLETITGLANDDKTNARSKPAFLQLVLTANKFSDEFRQSRPAFFIQKILFTILTPFAYLAGYRPVYKKYLD